MVVNATDCLLLNAALSIAKLQQSILEPISVNISVLVEDFRILDLNNMMFQMVFILTQQWFDSRLGASNIQAYKRSTGGKLWQPKITTNGEKNACCDNEDLLFWRVYGEEGHVTLSQKFEITNFCTTNYRNFPFDVQICSISFGSYRFLAEEVILKWSDEKYPWKNISKSNLKEFKLVNMSQSTLILSRQTGNFSSATLSFEIKRNYAWYLLLTFIPSVIATILSYFTLWMPKNQYKLKYITNGITVSYLLFLIGHYNMGLDYLKIIDIFLLKNIVFNLISLFYKVMMDGFYYCHANRLCLECCVKCYVKFCDNCVKTLFPIAYIITTTLFYFMYS